MVMLTEALWKEKVNPPQKKKEKVTHTSYTISRFLIASSRMEEVQSS